MKILTFLRGLQRRRQPLVVLLHVVVVEELAERDLGLRGIAHPPYVLDQLSQLAIEPLLCVLNIGRGGGVMINII